MINNNLSIALTVASISITIMSVMAIIVSIYLLIVLRLIHQITVRLKSDSLVWLDDANRLHARLMGFKFVRSLLGL